MIQKIVDLHIHSRYSRACSPDLELPQIALACEKKGIDICATGDFTHPRWLEHIKENLEEIGKTGLYKLSSRPRPKAEWRDPLKSDIRDSSTSLGMTKSDVRFILSTEVACIYKHKDATRRLHLVILAPDIKAVDKLIQTLEAKGANLRSDGRPILGLSGKAILQMLLDIDERFTLIPAHAWTPWFSVFGSKSGYDSLEECFEELTPRVRAIETGLSSDPTMNHRLSTLDNITLVSNSDAHGLANLGREANVLAFCDEKEITYAEIKRIIETGDRKKFLYTIEFYPEEGKYHFDGHLPCAVCLAPAETKKEKYLCPKCKKKVTVGVLHRVDDLADREEKNIPVEKFIPHRYIIPLKEIIGKVMGVGSKSKKVEAVYADLIKNLGSEFEILLHADLKKIEKCVDDKDIALAIGNMRTGKVLLKPGYDGQYGQVEVLPEGKHKKGQSRLLLE